MARNRTSSIGKKLKNGTYQDSNVTPTAWAWKISKPKKPVVPLKNWPSSNNYNNSPINFQWWLKPKKQATQPTAQETLPIPKQEPQQTQTLDRTPLQPKWRGVNQQWDGKKYNASGELITDLSQPWQNNGILKSDAQDADGNFVLSGDELQGAERAIFDQMTDQEKAQFEAIGEQAIKAWQDVAEAQAKYFADYKAEREFNESQEDKRLKIQWLNDENADIASSQRIEASRKRLNDLKANISYLWSMWRPWVSWTRLSSVESQIENADKVFRELQQVEKNQQLARELWNEYNAEAFERRMTLLEDDLEGKVNTAIQESLNNLTKAEIDWLLDTESGIESMRMTLLNNLDEEITWITDANIRQRQYVIDKFEQVRKEKQEYIQNKNVVNTEMSAVQWFYVDWNGDQIIDKNTGAPIPMPEEEAMSPIFDKDSGRLVQFSTDENGNIVPTVTQVFDQPTFEQNTIANYAQLVAQWKLDMNDVPEQVRSTDAFVQTLTDTSQQTSWLWVQYAQLIGQGKMKLSDVPNELLQDQTFIDQLTVTDIPNASEEEQREWKRDPDGWFYRTWPDGQLETAWSKPVDTSKVTWTKAWQLFKQWEFRSLVESMEEWKAYECWTRWQCGERFNDMFGSENGTHVQNTYASKQKFIDEDVIIGEEWMGVVYNLWGDSEAYWHVWVLASWPIERDWQIGYMVVSANSKWDEKLRKEFVTEEMIAWTDGWFIPNNIEIEQETSFDSNKFPQYRDFVLEGKTPSGMKYGSEEYDQFVSEARKWYVAGAKPQVAAAWLEITDEEAFIAAPKKVKEQVEAWLVAIPAFESSMDRLIELVDEHGTETLPSNARQEMRTLYKDAMLQAKEIYNLWVLNWPDLDIMEWVIPDPTARGAKLNQAFGLWVSYADAMRNAKDSVMWTWLNNAKAIWLSPAWTQQVTKWNKETAKSDNVSQQKKKDLWFSEEQISEFDAIFWN